MFAYLADQLLSKLQRRCPHPAIFVAADVLEGCAPDVKVGYCRRCGAIRVQYAQEIHVPVKPWRRLWPVVRGEWRLPDPNLWRDSPQLWKDVERLRHDDASLKEYVERLRREEAANKEYGQRG